MKRLLARLTYANVVASLALFIALGGGAYATTKLPKNSVGNAQLKDDAVDGDKVDDGSLTLKDFKKNAVHNGARGAAGARGPAGQPGANGEKGDKGDTGRQGPGAIALTGSATRDDSLPETPVLTYEGVRFYLKCGYVDEIGGSRNGFPPSALVGFEPAVAGTEVYFDGYAAGGAGNAVHQSVDNTSGYAYNAHDSVNVEGVVRAGSGAVMTFQLSGKIVGSACTAVGQIIPSE